MSNKEIYLPVNIFKSIIDYLDYSVEIQQRKLHEKMKTQFITITRTHPFAGDLRKYNNLISRNYSDTHQTWYKWYLLRVRNKTDTTWYNLS